MVVSRFGAIDHFLLPTNDDFPVSENFTAISEKIPLLICGDSAADRI